VILGMFQPRVYLSMAFFDLAGVFCWIALCKNSIASFGEVNHRDECPLIRSSNHLQCLVVEVNYLVSLNPR
jgi:hypothetical protein